MTDHDHVQECADKCAICANNPHLIKLPGWVVIECSNPNCFNLVQGTDVAGTVVEWNVKQRAVK